MDMSPGPGTDTNTKLSPVQRQILLFLLIGGPAYIATGHRHTQCREVVGGERWISTNTTTLWFLETRGLVIQDQPMRSRRHGSYRANPDHPAVQKIRLLQRRP